MRTATNHSFLERGQPVDEAAVRSATVQIAALIAVSRAARAVASGEATDAYLGRLARAEPILNEALGTPLP